MVKKNNDNLRKIFAEEKKNITFKLFTNILEFKKFPLIECIYLEWMVVVGYLKNNFTIILKINFQHINCYRRIISFLFLFSLDQQLSTQYKKT